MPDHAAPYEWQRPLFDLMDKLNKAGPGAHIKYVIGRKRDYLVIVDKDGKVVEDAHDG